MKKLFYIIAVILIVIWAVGFFVYALGALVHLLLILAIIIIAFRVARGTKSRPPERRGIRKYPEDPRFNN